MIYCEFVLDGVAALGGNNLTVTVSGSSVELFNSAIITFPLDMLNMLSIGSIKHGFNKLQ